MTKALYIVHWDLGDTEFEDMPYEQGIKAAGLPPVIDNDELEGDELSDWLSNEYGFTHFGFEPITCRSGHEPRERVMGFRLPKGIRENPVQPGQYFVIVDVGVPGGKMIGRTVYNGVREADRVAAAYRKKGRRVQVIDALWFEPGRQILQKTGMVANPDTESHLWHVVDRDKFIELYMELEITDDQSADLLRRSVEEIEERTQVTDSTQRAIRRLRNLVSRPLAQHGPEAGSWGVMDPKLTAAQRNQVFKIADELGLKLPSYSFNPLKSGWSQKVIRENISEMKDAGRPASQAVAASLDSARRSFRSRHAKKRFPSHLRFLKNPSMTYGDVPPYGDFLKRFCSATDGDDYAMHLKGSDLDAAEETVFSNDGRQAYEPEDTYIGIVQLVEKWEKGDEEAGSLASGILSTLGYEWI